MRQRAAPQPNYIYIYQGSHISYYSYFSYLNRRNPIFTYFLKKSPIFPIFWYLQSKIIFLCIKDSIKWLITKTAWWNQYIITIYVLYILILWYTYMYCDTIFESCNDVGDTIRAMFPCEASEKFSLGATKASYMVTEANPVLTSKRRCMKMCLNQLVHIVWCMMSLQTIKDIDNWIWKWRYWSYSARKVVVRHLKSHFINKATGFHQELCHRLLIAFQTKFWWKFFVKWECFEKKIVYSLSECRFIQCLREILYILPKKSSYFSYFSGSKFLWDPWTYRPTIKIELLSPPYLYPL